MLADFRAIQVEELVTKNVVRVMWFALSVYASTSGVRFDPEDMGGAASRWDAFGELVCLALVALVLYLISARISSYIQERSRMLREMLLSLDEHLKDAYVEQNYRVGLRTSHHYLLFRFFLRREVAIWFAAVSLVLGVRAVVLFQGTPVTL